MDSSAEELCTLIKINSFKRPVNIVKHSEDLSMSCITKYYSPVSVVAICMCAGKLFYMSKQQFHKACLIFWCVYCDGPALCQGVSGWLLAGLCCVFQVLRRRDCHEWMRYTWARWSVFILKLADQWGLPFSLHAVWGGCCGAALLFVVFLSHAHTHRHIHTLLHYWLLILIFCLLFINKFVTFVATSSPLPFLVTVLEPGCNSIIYNKKVWKEIH